VQPTNPRYAVVVAEEQLVSHAGIGLLAELTDRIGLTHALEQFAGRRSGRGAPPPARQGAARSGRDARRRWRLPQRPAPAWETVAFAMTVCGQ